MSQSDQYNAAPGDNPEQKFNALAQGITARVIQLEQWRSANDNLVINTETIIAGVISNLQTDLDALTVDITAAQVIADQLLAGQAPDALLLEGLPGSFYQDLDNSTGTLPDERLPERLGKICRFVNDVHSIDAAGLYRWSSSAGNSPDNQIRYAIAFRYDANALALFSFRLTGDGMMFKRQAGGVWQDWEEAPIKQSELDARYAQRSGDETRDFFAKLLTAAGGSVFIRSASLGSNSHVWFRDNDNRNTALIFSNPLLQRLDLRAYNATGTASTSLNLNFAGDMTWNGSTVLDTLNTPGITPAQLVAGTNTTYGRVNAAGVKAAIEAHAIGLGDGQTWQDVEASRSDGVSYQNSTGRTIAVAIATSATASVQVSSDNINWVLLNDIGNDPSESGISFVVPDGNYYRTQGASIRTWVELR